MQKNKHYNRSKRIHKTYRKITYALLIYKADLRLSNHLFALECHGYSSILQCACAPVHIPAFDDTNCV